MTDEEISLVKLISKAEDATEPSRDLDAEIALVLGWTFMKMKGDKYPYFRKPGVTNYRVRSELPLFTKSIDAALTLLPKGHWWAIVMRGNEDGFDASVIPPDTEMTWHRGANAALAICIAALKARFV